MNVPETAKRIGNWIAKFVNDSKTTGVVLGISGGIDSALAGVLSVKSLGVSAVKGMIIGVDSSPDSTADGIMVAKHLGVSYDVICLDEALAMFEHAVKKGGVIQHEIARANLKSRLRMCALYEAANETDRLVLGTTNLTEAVLGYYTKYGDGGIDLEPIIGLLKCEVRAMAAHLGIPESIVNRTPSADLWKGQTDEGELGFTYDDLDEVVLMGEQTMDTPVQKLVWTRFRQSEHKRAMPPGFTNIALESE
jgi:NAD+ synthase